MIDFITLLGITFIIGLSSSLHCLGMCGPLILSMPMKSGSIWDRVQYFLGKTLSYATLGAIIGTLGWGIYALEWQKTIAIICGVFLIILGLGIYKLNKGFSSGISNTISKWFSYFFNKDYKLKLFFLGYINGLLPCGMVYIALTTALVSTSPLEGALAMASFGLGTIPILFVLSIFKERIAGKYKMKFQKVGAIATVIVGVFMLLRGASLGIPYISPDVDISNGVKTSCCS